MRHASCCRPRHHAPHVPRSRRRRADRGHGRDRRRAHTHPPRGTDLPQERRSGGPREGASAPRLQRRVLPGRVTDRRRPGSRDPRGVQGRERRHRGGRRLAQHARSRPAEARREPRLRHRADGARRSRRRPLLRRHRRVVQPDRVVRARLEEPVAGVLRPDRRELPEGDRRRQAEADDVLHRDDGMEPAGRSGRVPAPDQGRRSAGVRRAHGRLQRHQLAAPVLSATPSSPGSASRSSDGGSCRATPRTWRSSRR